MIRTEKITINDKQFIRTYSDSGYMVECDGVQYDEAVDPAEIERTYTETDVMIEGYNEYSEAGKILLGVTE